MTVQIDGDDLVRGHCQRDVVGISSDIVRYSNECWCCRVVGACVYLSLKLLPVGYQLGFGVGLAVERNACGVLRAHIGLGDFDIGIGQIIVIELTGIFAVKDSRCAAVVRRPCPCGILVPVGGDEAPFSFKL